MRTMLYAFCSLLLAAALSSAQETTPSADDGLRSAPLPQLRTRLEAATEELRVLRSEATPVERRTAEEPALQEWVQALRDYVDGRERVEGLSDLENRLKQSAEEARKQLTQAQLELGTVTAPETLTEEEFRALEALDQQRRGEAQRAETEFTRARDRLSERDAKFALLPEEIQARAAALATVQSRLSELDVPPEERRRLERSRDSLIARRLALELQRDHHAELKNLEQIELEAARASLDVSKAREALDKRRFELARGTRDRQLEEAAMEARAEAARLEREAQQRANHPANRGAQRLESLVAQQSGKANEERRWEAEISSTLALAKEQEARIGARNVLIFERLPINTELDPLRQAFLLDQIRLLERRRERFDDWAKPIRQRISESQLALHDLADRLLFLEEMASVAAEWVTAGNFSIDADPGDLMNDPDVDLLLTAARDFLSGRKALVEEGRTDELGAIQTRWNEATTKLALTLEARRIIFAKLEQDLPELEAALQQARGHLEKRDEHLEKVRFWLKESPPFSDQELLAARDELVLWGAVLRAAPSQFLERARTRTLASPIWALLLGSLCFAGFLAWWRTRHIRPGEEGNASRSRDVLWKLGNLLRHSYRRGIGLFLLLIATAVAALIVLPEDVLLQAFFLALTAFALYRTVIVSMKAFLGGDSGIAKELPKTALHAQRMIRTCATVFLFLLVFKYHLRFLELSRLETLVGILLASWGLIVGAWLLVRRDVLNLIGSGDRQHRYSAWVRLVLLFLWPMLVFFFGTILVLELLGYRAASAYYARHSLLSLAALVALRLVFEILRAWVLRRTNVDEEEHEPEGGEDDEYDRQRLIFMRRVGMLILGGTTLAAAVPITLASLGFDLDGFFSALDWTIIPGKDDTGGTRLGNILGALFLMGSGVALAAILRDFFRLGRRDWKQGSRYAAGTLAFYIVVTITGLVSVRVLGIYLEELGWLLAPAGVAIGFGLTEILSNFVSGLILFIERPVQVGDVVTVGNVQGNVESISIRSTTVRTRDGISIILPNKMLITDNVTNWSHGDQRTRLHIPFSVAYGTDVALVKRVILDVAARDSRLMKRPRPEVSFQGFGDSQLKFELLAWLPTPEVSLHRRVLSDLNSAIDAAFRRAKIEIPFPQRDLHVRTMPSLMAPPSAEADEDAEEDEGK